MGFFFSKPAAELYEIYDVSRLTRIHHVYFNPRKPPYTHVSVDTLYDDHVRVTFYNGNEPWETFSGKIYYLPEVNDSLTFVKSFFIFENSGVFISFKSNYYLVLEQKCTNDMYDLQNVQQEKTKFEFTDNGELIIHAPWVGGRWRRSRKLFNRSRQYNRTKLK